MSKPWNHQQQITKEILWSMAGVMPPFLSHHHPARGQKRRPTLSTNGRTKVRGFSVDLNQTYTTDHKHCKTFARYVFHLLLFIRTGKLLFAKFLLLICYYMLNLRGPIFQFIHKYRFCFLLWKSFIIFYVYHICIFDVHSGLASSSNGIQFISSNKVTFF